MSNRIFGNFNDIEGQYKKVLCVCSAGLLRSATMAWVFAQEPYGFNCRCAGTEDYALVNVTYGLVEWCEEIVCAKEHHARKVRENFPVGARQIHVLGISDNYNYRDKVLVSLIKKRYDALTKGE